MESPEPAASQSKALTWIGRIVSVLPIPLLAMSAYMKISQAPDAVKGFAEFGFPANSLVPLGIVEAACAIVYLIPQTAVLGAVLLTGYLGGATCVHVNHADWAHVPIPVGLGVLAWLGLVLRDPRLRSVLPYRSLQ